MTTITFQIPDEEVSAITKLINEKGGTLFVTTRDKLKKKEKHSLTRALNEAQKIKSGETKALDFDDLWNR
jgi:hypothetical protein